MAQTEVDARSIFAQRLKAAREDAGLTQKELGMSVGLPQETAAVRINRYEKGVHDADLATARRIAQSLGVPLAFLYADTDVLAEAILTLGLLSKSEQRKAVADLKARLAQAGAPGEKG